MNIYRHKLLSHLLWRFVLKQPRFRKVLQRVLYPDKDVMVTLFGARLAINTQKELGYWRAAQNQLSNIVFRDEAAQLLTVSSLIQGDTTFVDCGANVGLWTCNIARLRAVYPALRVLSFEANPDTFTRLQASVRPFDNVQAFGVALSDTAGELRMLEAAGSVAFGVDTGHAFQIRTAPRTVPARPLDDFLGGIDNIVMKVDVEGHELEVLRGAKAALERGAFRAIYIDGFVKAREEELMACLADGGLTVVLNGRTLGPFQSGDHAVLALKGSAAPRV